MANPNKMSLMIGHVITALGFVVFFIPFEGAQQAAYGLFLLTGLLYTFLVEEGISGKYRGKGNSALSLLKTVISYVIPPLFVMIQAGLLFGIFSKYSNVMEQKDASDNLPGMLVAYNRTAFAIMMAEMILLGVYAGKVIRGAAHSNTIIRFMEKAIIPAFIGLGTLGIFYICLLYTVITRYLTDG